MNLRAQSSFRAGDFVRLEARLVPKLIAGARAGAEAVLEESNSTVPVDTGELKASGQVAGPEWKGHTVQAYVQYTAGHAGFVEFGTGLRGAGTYPYALPQTGTPFTGSWVYDYKKQGWIGMRAQPYLRPALDTARAAVLDAFRQTLGS